MKIASDNAKFSMLVESRNHFHVCTFGNVLREGMISGYLTGNALTRQRELLVHSEHSLVMAFRQR